MSIISWAKMKYGFWGQKSKWISLAPAVPASLAGWWPILSWRKCGYSHPLCSNVWFSIPDFSCQPWDHGAQEGWRLWNRPSQEGQTNSGTRGASRLSEEEEQTGTQPRWALGLKGHMPGRGSMESVCDLESNPAFLLNLEPQGSDL